MTSRPGAVGRRKAAARPAEAAYHHEVRAALLATTALVLVAGCNVFESKACTAIGCSNGATITIHNADFSTPPLAVTLEIDGQTRACPAPARGQSANCGPDVAITHRERADCKEMRTATAVSVSCTPNGTFEQVVAIQGTPARVAVALRQDLNEVGQRTFDLSYETVYPNGPDCDPGCKQTMASWPLP
jgi:hypothetical protein